MPHECTTCGRVFADGSKEMLSGCPDCGGNKFQFKPAAAESAPETDATTPEETPGDDGQRRDLTPDSREWPDHGYGADDTAAESPEPAGTDEPSPDSEPGTPGSAEDPAQADARSDVVSPDEIASGTPDPDGERGGSSLGDSTSHVDPDARTADPPTDDRPDLSELREELNEQFESIRIVAPGEYELNLMELYDRTEYIISLQEDGRYVIEVPDTWDTTPDPDGT